MFFYIGNNCPVQSMIQVTPNLYLDQGWSNHDDIYYKGYSTECRLGDSLYDIIDGYQPNGKYCVIHDNKIYHPLLRGFPLYYKNNDITNLPINTYTYIPGDRHTYEATYHLDLDTASSIIGDILYENTENFYRYNEVGDMNVLCSAGLDTIAAWAVLDNYTKDYSLHAYVPKNEDRTLHSFLGRIREYDNDLVQLVTEKYWGYGINSFFQDRNYYLTGYYGEIMQLRSGKAMNLFADVQNKKINELPEKDDYLYLFLQREKMIKQHSNSTVKCENEIEIKNYIYSLIFDDYQIWHLDHNMTFSPFYDVRIPRTMMHCDIESLTANALNGVVQRKIIERFNSEFISLVSDYKNEPPGKIWNNFKANISKIQFSDRTKLLIR